MRTFTLLALAIALALMGGSAVYANQDDDVLVSPQTILLGADQGGEVTVHVAIAYGSVDTASVALSGIPAEYTFSDARGELVAKFSETAVKDLVDPPSATLVLSCETKDGEPFSGSDVVRVVEWKGRP